VILRFGSAEEVFKAVIPASCDLSKEEEWISSLKNRTLTASGLISFYGQPGGHANPGKRVGNLAKRMKANLRTALES
jgi:hypothetical protein